MNIHDKVTFIRSLACLSGTIEAGSYTKAAQFLNMDQPAISRQVKKLENLLSTKLLSPTSRGMIPTHEGKEINKYAKKFDALFYELQNYSLDKHCISGRIRISITDGIGIYLMPHLVEFQNIYPKVCIEIISTHNETDLKDRKSDIAISYQYPANDDSLVLKQYERKFGLFASKSYIKKFGMPKDINDLLDNHYICNRQEYLDNWNEWKELYAKAKHIAASFDSSNLLIQATNNGLGISIQPLNFGKVQDNWIYLDMGITFCHPCWVASHYDDKETEKIKVMLNYIYNIMTNI